MTDPTGRSFLSYRRSRRDECERLVAAQRERGIPTWRDVDDMNSEPTESELRRIIRDGSTANVVLWITPETAGSPMIRNVEAPVAWERHDNNDGFFIVPVAAGGLGYAGAAAAIKNSTSITDLGNWNVVKLDSDPATDADIARVANQVLKQRLQAVDRHLLPDAPLRIALNTRQSVGHQLGQVLTIDWTHRFRGIQSREATAADWQEKLLPALADVSRVIQQNVPERRLLVGGLLSLSAATALGFHFMSPAGLDVAWEQRMPDGNVQTWSRKACREDSGFTVVTSAGAVDATDLAVLVSVNSDVRSAVAASSTTTAPFRAYVHIKRTDSAQSAVLQTPGQALDVAEKTVAAVRNARHEYGITGRVHLFTAIPAGLSMLIGQMLNTLGPVQTYEHIQSDATGCYKPAALLNSY